MSRMPALARKRWPRESETRLLAGDKGISARKRREQKGGNSVNLYPECSLRMRAGQNQECACERRGHEEWKKREAKNRRSAVETRTRIF